MKIQYITITTCLLLTLFSANCSTEDDYLPAYTRELRFEEETDTANEIAFLHLSDIHASTASLAPAVYYLTGSDSNFALLTGDIMITDNVINTLKSSPKPCLLIPGNHDIYRVYARSVGQWAFRKTILNAIGQESYAHFADEAHNYWYSDFTQGGHTLRVIGIDQYEAQSVAHPIDSWDHIQNLYSQGQVNWFIDLLEHSADADGIIIAIHNGFGNDKVGVRDTTRTGPFTSILASTTTEGYGYYGTGNTLMIPDIVEAYITGNNLTGRKYPNSTVVCDTLTVTTHFTRPADNFIAYFGGHLHYDIAEPLPGYPRQLQILITECGKTGHTQGLDDAPKGKFGNPSYCFNLNTVNFIRRQLCIKRIGACHKIDGTLRDSIIFNF